MLKSTIFQGNLFYCWMVVLGKASQLHQALNSEYHGKFSKKNYLPMVIFLYSTEGRGTYGIFCFRYQNNFIITECQLSWLGMELSFIFSCSSSPSSRCSINSLLKKYSPWVANSELFYSQHHNNPRDQLQLNAHVHVLMTVHHLSDLYWSGQIWPSVYFWTLIAIILHHLLIWLEQRNCRPNTIVYPQLPTQLAVLPENF